MQGSSKARRREETRTATTADDFTSDPGRAAFVWKPSPTTRTSQIQLTDVGKTGYHFVSVGCSKNGSPITVSNAATVTIAGLVTTDYVDCVFRNQRNTGKLKVEKRFIGQPVEVSLLIDDRPKAKSADASFDTGFVTVDVGTHGSRKSSRVQRRARCTKAPMSAPTPTARS